MSSFSNKNRIPYRYVFVRFSIVMFCFIQIKWCRIRLSFCKMEWFAPETCKKWKHNLNLDLSSGSSGVQDLSRKTSLFRNNKLLVVVFVFHFPVSCMCFLVYFSFPILILFLVQKYFHLLLKDWIHVFWAWPQTPRAKLGSKGPIALFILCFVLLFLFFLLH